MFNFKQIRELMGVIDFYHTLFIGQNIGKDTLTKKDLQILRSRGIDVKSLPKKTLIDYAYEFGIISQALGDERSKDLDFEQLKKFISSKNYIPLTKSEKSSLEYVKQQSYSDIKGLGNRISKDFSQISIEIDKKQRIKYEKTIQDELSKNILMRESQSELASSIGHKTKDWARDFDRISDYLMHNAYQHGIANQLLEQYGDDVKVFFSVYDGACEHCQRVYLTDGIGSEPKIFKLTDVISNGSNIGRKVLDWLPSISPLHPWCRCTLHLVPENGVWDIEKKQFIITRNKYGINRKSKVIIKRT